MWHFVLFFLYFSGLVHFWLFDICRTSTQNGRGRAPVIERLNRFGLAFEFYLCSAHGSVFCSCPNCDCCCFCVCLLTSILIQNGCIICTHTFVFFLYIFLRSTLLLFLFWFSCLSAEPQRLETWFMRVLLWPLFLSLVLPFILIGCILFYVWLHGCVCAPVCVAFFYSSRHYVKAAIVNCIPQLWFSVWLLAIFINTLNKIHLLSVIHILFTLPQC